MTIHRDIDVSCLTRTSLVLGGLSGTAAAVGELGGATTRLVRFAILLAVAGGVPASLLTRARGARLPRSVVLFDGAVVLALLLNLWTYAAAPTGVVGLAADLVYWLSLAVGGVLGVALAAGWGAAGRAD